MTTREIIQCPIPCDRMCLDIGGNIQTNFQFPLNTVPTYFFFKFSWKQNSPQTTIDLKDTTSYFATRIDFLTETQAHT